MRPSIEQLVTSIATLGLSPRSFEEHSKPALPLEESFPPPLPADCCERVFLAADSVPDCRLRKRILQSMKLADGCFKQWLIRVKQLELDLQQARAKRLAFQQELIRMNKPLLLRQSQGVGSDLEESILFRQTRMKVKISKRQAKQALAEQLFEGQLQRQREKTQQLREQVISSQDQLVQTTVREQLSNAGYEQQKKKKEAVQTLFEARTKCRAVETAAKAEERRLLEVRRGRERLRQTLKGLKKARVYRADQNYLKGLQAIIAFSSAQQIQRLQRLKEVDREDKEAQRRLEMAQRDLQRRLEELEEATSEERVLNRAARQERRRSSVGD